MIIQKYTTTNMRGSGLLISLIILIVFISASSCKKFLSSYSQNETFIQSAADLDEVLLGEGYNASTNYINNLPVWVNLLDDDAEENPSSNFRGAGAVFTYTGLHHWQSLPFIKSDGTLFDELYYTGLYKRISSLNTILYNIPSLREKNEPENILQRVSGESHFLRALYYFLLVNLYGQPYHTSTAATDYGIPLKTDPSVEDKLFARNTVKQVYEQIISDLIASEKELENIIQPSAMRANQAAAQALLSRVYLHMEEYENAITYANKVIAKQYRITNLNNYADGNVFLSNTSAETIFYMPPKGLHSLMYAMQPSSFTSSTDNFQVSSDLKNSFSANDLRVPTFFTQAPSGEFSTKKAGPSPNVIEEHMVRISEIYLNKAEALAVLERNEEAVLTLNELRKNRFKPEDLTNITATGAELVNFIREERRRELCFEWQRWFDLRRYGVNTKYPFGKMIRHISYAYDNSGRYVQGYYELKPYEQDQAAYVVPVPKEEIEFNLGTLFNETRPERPMIR